MRWWRAPLQVSVPWSARLASTAVVVPTGGVRRAAGTLSVVLPTALAVIGIVLAVTGATFAERPGTEAEGTLATELGAALWFGGVLTLGARSGATVSRAIGLVCLALGGAALVAASWALGWEGAALALSMELGVGAVAIAVLDVVLLGLLHGGLTRVAEGPEGSVEVALTGRWPFVRARVTGSAPGTAVGEAADSP